jgi:hypothetical protein
MRAMTELCRRSLESCDLLNRINAICHVQPPLQK